MDQVDGVTLIEFERARQVIEKGYDAKHDDAHTDGMLAHIAAYLVIPLNEPSCIRLPVWASETALHVRLKHGDDRIKILSIAGALIAAEIDRLLRRDLDYLVQRPPLQI